MGGKWSKRVFTPPVSSDKPEEYLAEIRNLCITYRHAIQSGNVSQSQRDTFSRKYMALKEGAELSLHRKYQHSQLELKERLEQLRQWAADFRAIHLRANAFKHLQEEGGASKERLLDTIHEHQDH